MRDRPRPGQKGAIDTILGRWERGESYTAIIAATRYGKSNIARAATLLGVERQLITCSLMLSPTSFLVKQIVKAEKWQHCLETFNAEWLQANGYPAISFQPKYSQLNKLKVRPNSNGEHLLSATVQLVERNRDIFGEWVESIRTQTGRPVAVFMDESHTGSESNTWGSALAHLAREGALIVLLTATAERSDGKLIPGFKFDEVDVEPVELRLPRPGSEPEKVRIDIYSGVKRKLRLRADYEVTFRQAFDEDALARISHTTFDVDLREVAGETYSGMLSELSVSRIPPALDKLVRHPDVVKQGCRELITSLRRYRTTHPKTLAIVFCGSDDERHGARRGDNQHPEMVKAELLYQAPEFRPVIFTSLDAEAEDNLLAFCEGGFGDIAIVKQMASLGLDSDLLKVGLDLSTTRTFAASVQRMMRVATPPPLLSHWISPADLLSKANFKRIVTNQGGEAKAAELELLDSYEVDRKEPKPKEVWRVGDVMPGDFDDSQQYHGNKEQYPVVQQFLSSFPALRSQYSDAYIAHHLRSFELTEPHSNAVTARDMSAEADAIRIEINEIADEATRLLIATRGLRWGQYSYGEIRKEVFAPAYGMTSWPYGVKLDELDDVTLLIAVRDAMQHVQARILDGEL
jgi:hypothetical protein